MSFICKCDRCGKFIQDFPEDCATFRIEEGYAKTYKRYVKHYCLSCYQSFDIWESRIKPDDPLHLAPLDFNKIDREGGKY